MEREKGRLNDKDIHEEVMLKRILKMLTRNEETRMIFYVEKSKKL